MFPEIESEKKTEAAFAFKSFPRRLKAWPAVDDDAAGQLPEAVTESPALSNSPAKRVVETPDIRQQRWLHSFALEVGLAIEELALNQADWLVRIG